jgi:molecular chaperone GrpE
MNDRIRTNSEGGRASSAPHASASEPTTPSEPETLNQHPTEQPEASAEAPAAGAPAAEDGGPHHTPENHAAKVEQDLEELAAKAQKADEYLELAQRTKADFENYRKRAAREIAAAQERGVVKLCRELLPAVDSLDRALAAADSEANGGDHDLASGIKLVHAEVLAALARVGVEPFSPEGERFDPEHHEAVAQLPVDGAESGTVVEVYQRGYRLGDAVIRPAKVVVAG